MNAGDWLARLGPSELPAFGHTLAELAMLRRQGDSASVGQAAAIILTDPYLTLRLLHVANDRPRHEPNVATLDNALMMLGLQAFFERVRSIAPLDNTALGRDARAMARVYGLLRQAQHAAWQARDFAVLHRDVRAEEVQVATLLYYLPRFLLWLKAPEVAARLERRCRQVDAETAETEVLGLPLRELRVPLLAAWQVPALTLDMLGTAASERTRPTIVTAALAIAEHCRRGWWAAELMTAYERLAAVENMPLETIVATVHGNAVRVARHGHWIPAPADAAWLVLEPGPWPEDADAGDETDTAAAAEHPDRETSTVAEKPSKPLADTDAAPGMPAEAPVQVCPIPDKNAFQASLQAIETHLDHSLNLNQMSAIILKGLHSGLGLSRIIFAMATPDGKRVKGRFTLGIPAQDPLRHFDFELESGNLFAQLMRKTQGVWVNEDNRARLWPMLGERLQAMIGIGDFYAMSLLSGSRPIGLIYADRGHGECGLDPLSYTDFKLLCLQAARGLSQIKG